MNSISLFSQPYVDDKNTKIVWNPGNFIQRYSTNCVRLKFGEICKIPQKSKNKAKFLPSSSLKWRGRYRICTWPSAGLSSSRKYTRNWEMLFHSCNFRKRKRSCTKQNQANVEKETLKEKSSAKDRTSVFKGSEEAHKYQLTPCKLRNCSVLAPKQSDDLFFSLWPWQTNLSNHHRTWIQN